jgi:hypothetical protein
MRVKSTNGEPVLIKRFNSFLSQKALALLVTSYGILIFAGHTCENIIDTDGDALGDINHFD